MSFLDYTRNVASAPGIAPALKLEPGRAYALLIDPARAPKPAKFEQHAVAAEWYQQGFDDAGNELHTWQPVTIYLRARELADLAALVHNEGRTIVQAWVELTPVVNAMTGEVRTRDDGSELVRRQLRFSQPVAEQTDASFADWSAPDRVTQPQAAPRVQYARPNAGPPAFVKPASK